MMGTFTFVGGGTGTRYTPYHIRHRTEVAGFMHFLHGDDRFYNNIFVQGFDPAGEIRRGEPNEHERVCGTWQFDEYPTYDEWITWFDLDVKRPNMGKLGEFHERHLPVWAKGNAYLKGAKPWQHETDHLVAQAEGVYVDLIEEEGQYRLKTNLFEHIGDFSGGVITSDILGNAFEPDQRFESPDGSDIVFDRDYFGDHRGLRTLPGPFAIPDTLDKALW